MKKGEILEGIVERVDFANKGIVNIDGKQVIVKNTIKGQTVQFMVKKVRKNHIESTLLQVVKKSDIETCNPVCQSFGLCGGCTYQTISYVQQLRMKEGQVRRLLLNICKSTYIWEGIKASTNIFNYRNKMEFSFGDEFKEGPLALGLHKRGSFHDIVTINDCKIVDEDFNDILRCVLDYCTRKNLDYYHKLRHKGFLRHLLIRKGFKTKEILINIVTTSELDFDFSELVGELLALPDLNNEIVGILHIMNDSLADVVKADDIKLLYGRDFFYEEILGLKFKITPFSFFQTNSLGAEILYETVREYIGDIKNTLIFDLYSGTGTIAQILTSVARKVIGVEIVEEAVEAAKVNAKLNGITNCDFIVGDVLKVLDTIEVKPDIIVIDPPRDGIHPKALKKIIDFGVEQIIYVSCKPTSLVRDLEVLMEAGYVIKRGCCVDMFPNTVHVESVVLLTRKDG